MRSCLDIWRLSFLFHSSFLQYEPSLIQRITLMDSTAKRTRMFVARVLVALAFTDMLQKTVDSGRYV